MQRCEYCLLKHHKTDEHWIYFASTEEKRKFGESLGKTLSWLGSQGWEAVNYAVENLVLDSAHTTWPRAAPSMTTGGVAREILFKRPISS